MDNRPASTTTGPGAFGTAPEPPAPALGALDAQIHETHTGLVVLVGDRAYKAKKAIKTDFLDFTTVQRRAAACRREIELNSRLSPQSYLGIAYLTGPGDEPNEPVVVMRRYRDEDRLSTLVRAGAEITAHLDAIARTLAEFHRGAVRGDAVDDQARPAAVWARWEENLTELQRLGVVPAEQVDDVRRLASRYLTGRAELFADRIDDGRVVDGHADLLANDIFCTPTGLAILDCLEFDDALRYVDGIDDAAFLAMDLEFLGAAQLGGNFIDRYRHHAHDPAPRSLVDFYIAYRAVVRAKVDCIRVGQGQPEAAADAQRHLDIALDHLRSATVQLIIVGGGPGTGKTTISQALAAELDAVVISTDDVRRELRDAGVIGGAVGELGSGLYAPENVAAVYDEVLARARHALTHGRSVILDGTWRDDDQRRRAHQLAADTAAPIVELTCSLPVEQAGQRIAARTNTTSDATPEIARALADQGATTVHGHPIDTSRPVHESVAEAQQICCLAI
ncbi:hypothetical protein C731_3437 [Mycolicibacterium hassiacum DSM 44199]|jgi:hypothetical protein|uniref:Uncharacterized protein n=1 Tax=Mycolicibacterium hassiacum (strain DSM 44199 / CIP 105218 / JCM 12690 / 3849) TaxID=1122247 RepID=K5BJ89_MYCHD|nr:AAA family ATPase [Mycolicibacterium hassiacum]EKF22694.1 hypothetical protein C731_3437 [Mycolicibacterium hassiacum DSM 44199]MBX5485956.1 AAA family ATPase [Mycolicibacterium hassiacum]MDA4088866.1 hypothetical protein [Mycolicibacterium hassiacum DSM 44199]VCT91595.1 Adenylate kinase [Mycolicibacterium hassiacum DSM 44199]